MVAECHTFDAIIILLDDNIYVIIWLNDNFSWTFCIIFWLDENAVLNIKCIIWLSDNIDVFHWLAGLYL
jgi:hypothetical protein